MLTRRKHTTLEHFQQIFINVNKFPQMQNPLNHKHGVDAEQGI